MFPILKANKEPIVYLLYKEQANTKDMLKGIMHSYIARVYLKEQMVKSNNSITFNGRKALMNFELMKKFHHENDNSYINNNRTIQIELIKKSFEVINKSINVNNVKLSDLFMSCLLKENNHQQWKIEDIMLEQRYARLKL